MDIFNTICHNPKYSDRQAWTNNVDPDQMPQNTASDQGLYLLLHIHQLFYLFIYYNYNYYFALFFFLFWFWLHRQVIKWTC